MSLSKGWWRCLFIIQLLNYCSLSFSLNPKQRLQQHRPIHTFLLHKGFGVRSSSSSTTTTTTNRIALQQRVKIRGGYLTDESNRNNNENGTVMNAATEGNRDENTSSSLSMKDELEKVLLKIPVKPAYQTLEDINTPTSSTTKLPKRGLILVDCFCPYHGKYLEGRALEVYGAGIVNVFSTYMAGFLHFTEPTFVDELSMRIPRGEEEAKHWKMQIPFPIHGIICESDSGLGDAERLGVNIGLYPSRHDGYNRARRDKFLMNKQVSEYGLPVVKQKMCSSEDEAVDFAKELGVPTETTTTNTNSGDMNKQSDTQSSSFQQNDQADGLNPGTLGHAQNTPTTISPDGKYCIVKPCRGVASDDVHFCSNIEEVRAAFKKVHQSSVFGSTDGDKHSSVLVQEFASGTEYAIDIISKAGEHKVAAIWRYDKRAVNGAPFVYFATEVIDSKTPSGEKVCDYAMKALDALNIKWGLSHSEVIVDEEHGPRLVEVNCRQHNTDFAPLTSACMGYNALDMLLEAYLGEDSDELGDMLDNDYPPNTEHLRIKWNDIPPLPTSRAYGAIVHLVCHVRGVITKVNDSIIREIHELPSVQAMELYPAFSEGNYVEQTKDIRSDCGWVHLIHGDQEQFKKDYDRIVEAMPQMFTVDDNAQ